MLNLNIQNNTTPRLDSYEKEVVFVDLSDRVSQDVIKIFHNAKCSIISDALKWTKALHNTNTEVLEVNENFDSRITIYTAKDERDDENPSIFGEQPVSEYAQQPFPSSKNNKSKEKNKIFEVDTEVDKRFKDEKSLASEDLKRDKDLD